MGKIEPCCSLHKSTVLELYKNADFMRHFLEMCEEDNFCYLFDFSVKGIFT